MAIAFVKGGGNHTESGGSVSYTFTGDVTSGNLLVVGVGRTKDGSLEPIDTGDIALDGTSTCTIGSWSMDVSEDAENFSSSTYDLSTAIFSTIITGTGTCKLNFSGGSNAFIQCIGAATFSGSWDSGRVEDTASTSYLTGDMPQSGNATSAGAAVFVGMLHLLIGDETIELDNDAAYTLVYESFGQYEATISYMYQLVGSGTTDSADWEYNHSGPAAPCLAVYKEAAASEVTGTGALSAQAPSITSAATSGSDGVGAFSAQGSTASGTGTAGAITYYVDTASSGGDGTTMDTSGEHAAWATLASVYAHAESFNPGDEVLLKRGCTWRETLTVPSSGSAGNPITFGAYGTGADPIISGADVVSSWTQYVPTADYFNDDFEDDSEGENPTNWDAPTETNGTVNVAADAAKNGTYGVRCTCTTTAGITYNNKDFGSAVNALYVGFWLRAHGEFTNGTWGFVGYFRDQAETKDVVRIFWNYASATGMRLEVGARIDDGNWTAIQVTPRFALDTWVWVEIGWSSGDGTGVIKTRINGGTWDDLTNLDNDATYNEIDQISLGFVGNSQAGTNGSYFDYDDVMVDASDASVYPVATDAYTATLAQAPVNVYEDTSTLYTNQADIGTVVSTVSSWYHTGTTLYVHTSTGAAPAGFTIVATQRDYCVYGTGKDYITVDGITCHHAEINGIYALDGDGWTIQNNTVEYYYTFGILSKGDAANTDRNTGTVITGNTIGRQDHANTNVLGAKGGIGCHGCDDPKIYSNTVSGADSWGIVLEDTTPDAGGGLTSQNGDVYLNEITSCQGGIDVTNCSGTRVYRNYIHDSKGAGIAINWGANNVEVSYNLLTNLVISDQGNHYNGIDFYEATGGKVWNNTVVTVRAACLTLESHSTGADVRNNILVSQSNTGLTPTPIYVTADSQDGLTLSNNVYYDGSGGTDVLGVWGATTYTRAEIADWNTETSDSGSLVSDPLFASASDFRLTESSPCINAGTDVGLTTDYLGNSIVDAPDIGAYDFPYVVAFPAYGYATPDAGEIATSWTTWHLGAGAGISGDADYGDLVIPAGVTCDSPVVNMGDANNKEITLSTKYGSNVGTVTRYIRGSDTTFAWDDGSPSWTEYTGAVTQAWQYVQARLVGA